MGYYDQDYEQAPKNQKGNNKGYLIASLVGVVLGALLVIIAVPTLINYNVLPYNIEPESEETAENGAPESAIQKNISVNVTTQVTRAVEKVSNAVVGVTNIQANSFWNQQSEAGTGSGVIYKKAGDVAYIVTNHHVVDGADQVEITLADGSKVPAQMRGTDIWSDLAVLEIPSEHVAVVAEFGDSNALTPGEPVIAIGNPLGLQFSGSVTKGIISGLERAIPIDIDQNGSVDWQAEVIQTDAAINPGNSGGALVNIEGQVIGINSMKIAQSAVEGIGLSIPVNYAIPIIQDLERFGEVQRPTMGITLGGDVSSVSSYHQRETLGLPEGVEEGVFLSGVIPNSPADLAGLQELDVIIAMDDEPIADILQLRKYLYTQKNVGDQMSVTIYRNGEKQEVVIKLAKGNI
ncbi:serine protease HtrC [Bacillus carboniphilus]|uniref:Serine protease HtrC n=1 Tax=Bacillus carboniphilus TaxID=86663 RepID=A0ABP3G4Y9_9BACI